MNVMTWSRRIAIAALAGFALLALSGCDDGGGGDGGGTSSVVGKWELYEGTSVSGAPAEWWQFNEDGTFAYFNNSDFTSKHLGGTYSQDGKKVTGTFTNPGVGEGEIDVTLSDDGKTMQLDFIEHWHSPYKHVAWTGVKL